MNRFASLIQIAEDDKGAEAKEDWDNDEKKDVLSTYYCCTSRSTFIFKIFPPFVATVLLKVYLLFTLYQVLLYLRT